MILYQFLLAHGDLQLTQDTKQAREAAAVLSDMVDVLHSALKASIADPKSVAIEDMSALLQTAEWSSAMHHARDAAYEVGSRLRSAAVSAGVA